jgi:hypothetical protein
LAELWKIYPDDEKTLKIAPKCGTVLMGKPEASLSRAPIKRAKLRRKEL